MALVTSEIFILLIALIGTYRSRGIWNDNHHKIIENEDV